MNNIALAIMLAAGNPPQAPEGGNMLASLLASLGLPLILIGSMWFFLIRPQRKEQKQRAADIKAMRVGDSVVTIGGIVGKVVNLKDNEITISTSVANTMMTFRKEAIDKVIKPINEEDL